MSVEDQGSIPDQPCADGSLPVLTETQSPLALRKWSELRGEVTLTMTRKADDADMVRLNEAVRAFVRSLAGEWRDIATYEGCHAVLVSRPTGAEIYAATSAFMDATGVWRVYRSEGGMTPLPFAPSHWMPLPAPPAALAKSDSPQ